MPSFKKNKKAMDMNIEAMLYIALILVLCLILFFTNNAIKVSTNNLEKIAPELTYQYPSLFVKSFLMLEISKEDKEKLNLNLSQKYYVQDLIYLGDSESKKIIDKLRTNYINKFENEKSLTSFKNFAQIEFSNSDLLVIRYGQNFPPNLEEEIKHKNYGFYFKGKDNKYRHIFFMQEKMNLKEYDYGNVGHHP